MQTEVRVTPDQLVFFQLGFVRINATIVFSWAVMAILILASWLITRRLSTDPKVSRWQTLLEMMVGFIRQEIREVTQQRDVRFLFFLGSLFLFIAMSNLLTILPWYEPPTSSLNTTGALAVCVFFAVPIFGIMKKGITGYFKRYITPTPFMLPFNIISDLSRTLALAVRLFGNIMSGSLIVAILISVVPLFVPIVMRVLGLLIGLIQAYIFAILSAVYIGSATRRQLGEEQNG